MRDTATTAKPPLRQRLLFLLYLVLCGFGAWLMLGWFGLGLVVTGASALGIAGVVAKARESQLDQRPATDPDA